MYKLLLVGISLVPVGTCEQPDGIPRAPSAAITVYSYCSAVAPSHNGGSCLVYRLVLIANV